MDPHLHASHPHTSDLRASDTDRHQVIDALTRHTAAGRLTLDEFTARVDATSQAKTYRELAAVTADLPTTGAVPGAESAMHRTQLPRPAVALVAVLAAALVVLLAGTVLAMVAGWGDMHSMMSSMMRR
jgi:DUF1707 SHOCT-like domain